MKMERRIGDVRERSCAHIVSWSVRLLQRATTMNMSLNFESFLFSKMSTPENWMISICSPRHAPEHGNSRAKAPWHENERANHFDTKMSVQSSIAWRWLLKAPLSMYAREILIMQGDFSRLNVLVYLFVIGSVKTGIVFS